MTTYPVKYLIISDRMFESTLQPLIEWKTRKGFKVIIAYTDVIGNTTTAIKSYILTQYTNGTPSDPAPTYVLLVGDVAQVPAFQGSGHVTDLYYGEMDGGADVIPDIYYGRLSAQTTGQLEPQITKTLQYEQYTMPDPSFLQYSVLVAGVDAGNAPTYGNGQINYGADNYFNPTNGITSHTYLYGSGSPITSDNPLAASTIHQNVSDGAGFVNYTAHCGSSGWSDPSFTQSDVAALTNVNKYCFMVGNCCQSNKFEESECFGEAILRAINKGAIGYIGASDYSYWNEDYYFSVGFKTVVANPNYDAAYLAFYDRMFHTNGETEAEWHISGGEIIFGGNLAVT
ncbi:MAG: Gingipain R, partial [Bacteroidetes bacterium CG_4_10_14_3_um_filter_31_20]